MSYGYNQRKKWRRIYKRVIATAKLEPGQEKKYDRAIEEAQATGAWPSVGFHPGGKRGSRSRTRGATHRAVHVHSQSVSS